MCRSLPLRERGLKRVGFCAGNGDNSVAPPAGAWIETNIIIVLPLIALSLPLRERGLKPLSRVRDRIGRWSLPLRERGLKLNQVTSDLFFISRSPCGSVD